MSKAGNVALADNINASYGCECVVSPNGLYPRLARVTACNGCGSETVGPFHPLTTLHSTVGTHSLAVHPHRTTGGWAGQQGAVLEDSHGRNSAARGAEPSNRVASARNAKERKAKCELSVNEASKAKGLLASVWTISSTRCEIVCGA